MTDETVSTTAVAAGHSATEPGVRARAGANAGAIA